MNGTAEEELLLAMFGSESVRADNVTLQKNPLLQTETLCKGEKFSSKKTDICY